ncbi:MAG: hypothetical protein H6Q85_2692, partial [candidate division NC10 bacterium]|nr:hypothetical protein [candidate division NC10 bacterium]
AHLGGRPEQRIVLDDTRLAHAVQEFGDLFHAPIVAGSAPPSQGGFRLAVADASPTSVMADMA